MPGKRQPFLLFLLLLVDIGWSHGRFCSEFVLLCLWDGTADFSASATVLSSFPDIDRIPPSTHMAALYTGKSCAEANCHVMMSTTAASNPISLQCTTLQWDHQEMVCGRLWTLTVKFPPFIVSPMKSKYVYGCKGKQKNSDLDNRYPFRCREYISCH